MTPSARSPLPLLLLLLLCRRAAPHLHGHRALPRRLGLAKLACPCHPSPLRASGCSLAPRRSSSSASDPASRPRASLHPNSFPTNGSSMVTSPPSTNDPRTSQERLQPLRTRTAKSISEDFTKYPDARCLNAYRQPHGRQVPLRTVYDYCRRSPRTQLLPQRFVYDYRRLGFDKTPSTTTFAM
ncbi:hypothetical protein TRIUR3_30498 [Triticum urartu]|uniref:Uncharacterized protein n=1 Tax=Triticum urartu TaxID=4572 RepID=M7ZGW8_TRIUA|nr:hypothetical protein TRIUR3_30498 [Triticum urartu]